MIDLACRDLQKYWWGMWSWKEGRVEETNGRESYEGKREQNTEDNVAKLTFYYNCFRRGGSANVGTGTSKIYISKW